MCDRRIEAFQPAESGSEMLLHPFWRFAAAGACKSDCLAVREARKQRFIRHVHEQNCIDAVGSHGFHYIRRAGEIVAVIRQKKIVGHYSPPFPNFAIEAASSGWSVA